MRRAMQQMGRFCTVVTSLACLAGPQAAWGAPQPPAAVVIFDSTNSMWSQIDGVNKVVIMREAMGKAFEDAADKIELGLMTYGTRSANACTAVETVMPVGQVTPQAYSEAVNRISPGKGSTPLARALNEAAQSADYQARPTSLIVISDGLDNCHADPCAVAADLKYRSPALRIHVVAFDRQQKDELAGLNCMASETGGAFFTATSTAELNSALSSIIALTTNGNAGSSAPLALIADAASEITGTVDGPGSQIATPPQDTTGKSAAERLQEQIALETTAPRVTMRLAATLAGDTAPIHSGLVWRVFSAVPDETGSFKVVARGEDPNPVFELSAGDYIVHVAYGRANATKELAAKQGVIDETVVLNAGGLRVMAQRPDGTAIPESAINYSVYSSEQDQLGERKLILAAIHPGKIVRLNAGSYHLVSQYGNANAVVRSDVKVEAGKLSDATVTHLAASITLKLVNEPGGEALANTSWSVLTPDGDIVAESIGAFPNEILAEGTYSVIARHEGQAYNKEFSVEAGIDQEVEIVAGN